MITIAGHPAGVEFGTQLSEAFARPSDRIRREYNIRRMGDRGTRKTPTGPPLPDVRGEIVFDDVTFEYNPGAPVAESTSSLHRAPAGESTTALGRPRADLARGTLIRPGDDYLQKHRPQIGAPSSSTGSTTSPRSSCANLPPASGRGAAGQFPLRRDDCRETSPTARPHAFGANEIKGRSARIAHCDEFNRGVREGVRTPSSANAAFRLFRGTAGSGVANRPRHPSPTRRF